MDREKDIGFKDFEKHGLSYVVRRDRDSSIPYDECCCCGKLITKTLFSIDAEDGLEYLYGAGCYRKLKVKHAE